MLCVNFLGDGLRDALDPRAKGSDSSEAKNAKKAAKKARKQSGKQGPGYIAGARTDRSSIGKI